MTEAVKVNAAELDTFMLEAYGEQFFTTTGSVWSQDTGKILISYIVDLVVGLDSAGEKDGVVKQRILVWFLRIVALGESVFMKGNTADEGNVVSIESRKIVGKIPLDEILYEMYDVLRIKGKDDCQKIATQLGVHFIGGVQTERWLKKFIFKTATDLAFQAEDTCSLRVSICSFWNDIWEIKNKHLQGRM